MYYGKWVYIYICTKCGNTEFNIEYIDNMLYISIIYILFLIFIFLTHIIFINKWF